MGYVLVTVALIITVTTFLFIDEIGELLFGKLSYKKSD